MYIVMVSSECAPATQVGGLGEVVFGLSRELEIRGNTVEVVLPKYDGLHYDHIRDLAVAYHDLWVPWYGGAICSTVWFGSVNGRRCFFIEPHSQDNFFHRRDVYGFPDDVARFSFFSRAAMEFLAQSGRRPDVIHGHDWQTGLVPVLLHEIYAGSGMDRSRICFTIHNFGHQGITGENVLWATGLGQPERFGDRSRLGDDVYPGALNLLKGGIVYSNFVTTVSPQYAKEALHTERGMGLGNTLQAQGHKFAGVLNGIDYDVWNPETDPLISSRYGQGNLDDKYENKEALRERLWLRQEHKPLLAYVGRLARQKGVELIEHAIFWSLATGCQFVLIGSSPDQAINEHFWQLKDQLNDSPDCHLELSYDEELAHLVYAGADLVLVPSRFEPCGLAQLMALRYGSVPIVRATGGLLDTVFDRDYSSRPPQERNGYVFEQADNAGLESALNRAIGLWSSCPQEFRAVMENAMGCEHSWSRAGETYLDIYHRICSTVTC